MNVERDDSVACCFGCSREPGPQLSADSTVSDRRIVGEPSVEDRSMFASLECSTLIGLAVLSLRVNKPGLLTESPEQGVVVVHVEVASHV